MFRVVALFVGAVLSSVALAACPNGCMPTNPTGTGLQVTDPNVRACDAVFSTGGDEVPSVTFAAAVNGESVPQAPRFAISFAAASDASLVGQELATFQFTRSGNAAPTLVESRCFDAAGAAVTGNPITLTE